VFGRLRAWSGRHPRITDALWLTPFLLVSLLNVWTVGVIDVVAWGAERLGLWGFAGLTLLLFVPLFWLRERPVAVFAIISLTSFLQWLLGVQPLFFNVSVLVAMYGVASRRPLRWAVGAGLVVELGLFLVFGRVPQGFDPSAFATASAFAVAIWMAGIYANTRRRYLESLEERAERAERERDQQARLAAAAERARIARELHDVVAHSMSLIAVQAGVANYVLSARPDEATRVLSSIEQASRDALRETRRLLGLLRDDGGRRLAPEFGPAPGLADLGGLIARTKDAGVRVDLEVRGRRRALPAGVDLAAFRIIQEALTNVVKHSAAQTGRVLVAYEDDGVHIKVTDDGRGGAAGGAPEPAGHGIVGMRERAGLYGGEFHAGPLAGRGFEVAVSLPLEDAR
jgi:signal transduction histidine kinase